MKSKNKTPLGELDAFRAILSFFWLFCKYPVFYLPPSLNTGSDATVGPLPLTVQNLCDLCDALPGHWSP